jgi:predicted ATP-grasp superfamily ATP-dependent carboligase
VRLEDGEVRRLDWPVTEVYASVPHNLLVLQGAEPNLRWRAFSDAVVDVAKELGTDVMVTLGALLADTPHTRPVPITATSSDPDLVSKHGLGPSSYEGPTGIVGVLHDACTRAGVRSASLWAATPHYISAAPNPQAATALLDRLHVLVGTPGPSRELRRPSRTTPTSPATWSSWRSRRTARRSTRAGMTWPRISSDTCGSSPRRTGALDRRHRPQLPG